MTCVAVRSNPHLAYLGLASAQHAAHTRAVDAARPLPPGGHRLLGEPLEATGRFASGGTEPGAPWAPQHFMWRGRAFEVLHVEPLGRRMGPALESRDMAPYVRGHRLLLTTRQGPVLLVEGLRGGRGAARWRALCVWETPAPPPSP